MSEANVKDRRKYQRVHFEASPQSLSVNIEGYGASVVFDMSYNGAALAQPSQKPVENAGDLIKIHLVTEIDKATVEARIVRATAKAIACEFIDIPSTARIIIDRLVTDRMIGLNMQLIDPSHYSPQSDFSHWFYGPKETNLFLWAKGDKLTRAQFNLNNVVLVYEDDEFFFENKDATNVDLPKLNNQQILQKASAIITQMHSNVQPLMDFKKLIAEQIG